MEQSCTERESFGGIAGRVLVSVIGPESFLLGLGFVVGSLAIAYPLAQRNAEAAAAPIIQIWMAYLLARAAVSGFHGDTGQGARFADPGESREAVFVALRYLALSVLWVVPVALLAKYGLSRGGDGMDGFGGMGGLPGFLPYSGFLSLGTLYLAAIALMPPVTLIASVGAGRTRELLSPGLWAALFRGRRGELFLIYALCLGGVAALVVIFAPVLLAIGFRHPKVAAALLIFSSSFAVGFSVRLLGRLCGLFARGALVESDEGAFSVVTGGGTNWQDRPDSPPKRTARTNLTEAERLTAFAQSALAPEPEAPAALPAAAKPALADAKAQVDALLAGLDEDPEGTVAALEELHEAYATHPLVLAGLCHALARSGRGEEALASAQSAIPWLLERGNLGPAAAVLRDVRGNLPRLNLPAQRLHEIADHAWGTRDIESATAIYMQILKAEPSDNRAIKRMLQAGEAFLQGARAPGVALGIYRFLLARCASSPFEEYMRRGLEEAERLVEAGGRRTA